MTGHLGVSQEMGRPREWVAFQKLRAALREYADATWHNPLITEDVVADTARLTFRLEQARLDDHHGSAA